MATTVSTKEQNKTKPNRLGGNGFSIKNNGRDNGGGGPKSPGPDKYKLGLWIIMGSIVMFFMSLASALVIREISSDWEPMAVPPALWISSAVLIVSSITIELGRRSLKADRQAPFRQWFTVTTVLGLLFVVGQLLACWQLRAKGIFLATNPHSSFFYLLTVAHGVHLLGGIIALSYVSVGAWRGRFSAERRTAVDLAGTYWHFMDILWVFLFLLLFVWK